MIKPHSLDELSGVADVAEQRELSDNLSVSSALYLGASDMLKLHAMLEQPDDQAHALCVLRRLSTVPITAQLESTTGILALMRELSTDEIVQAAVEAGSGEAGQAASLIMRIISVWEAQLEEERQQRDAQQQRSVRLQWASRNHPATQAFFTCLLTRLLACVVAYGLTYLTYLLACFGPHAMTHPGDRSMCECPCPQGHDHDLVLCAYHDHDLVLCAYHDHDLVLCAYHDHVILSNVRGASLCHPAAMLLLCHPAAMLLLCHPAAGL